MLTLIEHVLAAWGLVALVALAVLVLQHGSFVITGIR